MAKPALSTIYKGSFKDRPRFDGGGYVDYSGGDLSPIDTSWADPYYQNQNSGAPTAGEISAETAGAANTPAPTVDPGANPGGSSSQGALGKILAGMGLGGGDTSNAAALGAAVKLLSAYGQYQTNKNGQKLPALPSMPALGGLPSLPGSSNSGYGPPGGYNFQNYGAGRQQAPAQPAPSYFTYGQGPEQQFFQQVKPGGGPIAPVTGMATGGAVKGFDVGGLVPGAGTGGMQNILGQGAMAQPGQTPMTPRPMSGMPGQQPGQVQPGGAPPQAPPQAQIGLQPRPSAPPPQAPPSTMMQRMQPPQRPQMPQMPGGMQRQPQRQQFATGGDVPQQGALNAVGQSRHITGPGDGTSDSIPARLANGEYVIDAQAVSMLGNGDNGAGAKKLDEFRKNLRQHKGGALSKGQMAPDAKPVHKYMGGQ